MQIHPKQLSEAEITELYQETLLLYQRYKSYKVNPSSKRVLIDLLRTVLEKKTQQLKQAMFNTLDVKMYWEE